MEERTRADGADRRDLGLRPVPGVRRDAWGVPISDGDPYAAEEPPLVAGGQGRELGDGAVGVCLVLVGAGVLLGAGLVVVGFCGMLWEWGGW